MRRIRLKSVLQRKVAVAFVSTLLCVGGAVALNETEIISTMAKADRKLPIYCVGTDEKKISISFDAAWGADDTDELIEILNENDVKTTFFMCGYWVEKYPEEVMKIALAGHDLGNHSSTHPHMNQLTKAQIKKELQDTHEKVYQLTGYEMDLFRPPFGEYNNTVLEVAEDEGYYTIQWDVDSLDWMEHGVQTEIDRVLNHKNLRNGSIVLFHNDAKYTPAALDTIIKGLKAKGYEIVPLSELIHRQGYHMDHEGRQVLDN